MPDDSHGKMTTVQIRHCGVFAFFFLFFVWVVIDAGDFLFSSFPLCLVGPETSERAVHPRLYDLQLGYRWIRTNRSIRLAISIEERFALISRWHEISINYSPHYISVRTVFILHDRQTDHQAGLVSFSRTIGTFIRKPANPYRLINLIRLRSRADAKIWSIPCSFTQPMN